MAPSTFSSETQKDIARAEAWMPMIAGAHPEITDIDDLWGTTRDTPFHVSREAFRYAATEFQDHEKVLDLVNRLPENDLVPRMWFKKGYQHLARNYMYVVTYTGYNIESGELYKQPIPVYSDESLSIQEVLDAADERMDEGEYPMAYEGRSSWITTAYHREGGEW